MRKYLVRFGVGSTSGRQKDPRPSTESVYDLDVMQLMVQLENLGASSGEADIVVGLRKGDAYEPRDKAFYVERTK